MNDKKKIKERKSTIDGNTAIVVNKLKEIGLKIFAIYELFKIWNIIYYPCTEITLSSHDIGLIILLIIFAIEKAYPIKIVKRLRKLIVLVFFAYIEYLHIVQLFFADSNFLYLDAWILLLYLMILTVDIGLEDAVNVKE